MKALIRYSRRQVVSYCGLIITLTILMVSSTVVAQEDSDPYPVGPALDGAAVLVEIKDGEAAERPAKQEIRPLTADPNPDRSILPDPGPAVPNYLAERALEPLPETPNQPLLPAAVADLIVEDIWSTTNPLQAGQEENVTFRIKNQGTANISTTFLIRFSLDGAVKAAWSSGGLLAGQAAEASTTVIANSAGSHQVKIEVDYDDRIVESNESNNVRTETWSWGTSPVDLIVEDIWSTTNPLRAGEVEDITFRIRNVGTAAVPVDFHSQLLIDGSSAGTALISGLAAGTSVTRSIEVTVEIPGSHEVKVTVDNAGAVPEFNENNNSRVESWNWGERPVDFIVTDIWSTTSPLQAGMVENISFGVKNEGIVSTPATFHAMLLVDGTPAGEKTFSGIDAGATLAADVDLQLNEPGLHELIVIVDHTNLVPETNEGNNERVESWTWQSSPIDLVVDDVWPTTEPLETGSGETIKLQIRNQGTEAVEGIFDTRLSIGEIYTGTVQTDGLAAGAAAVKAFDIQINDPGVHEVRVIVDHAGVVVEGDEANNEWVESWEWIGEKVYQLVLPVILRKE